VTIFGVTFATVDIIIFAICMLSAVVSAIRGFVSEFFHFGGILIGLLSGCIFTSLIKESVSKVFPSLPSLPIALMSFVLMVLAGYLLVRAMGSMMKTVIEQFSLSALDGILGFAWGIVEAAIVLALVSYVLTMQSVISFDGFFSVSAFYQNFIKPLQPMTVGAFEAFANEL